MKGFNCNNVINSEYFRAMLFTYNKEDSTKQRRNPICNKVYVIEIIDTAEYV